MLTLLSFARACACSSMGNAYMQQQDFDKALENHTKDYDIAVAKVCVWGGYMLWGVRTLLFLLMI